jgi:hypothetical protein
MRPSDRGARMAWRSAHSTLGLRRRAFVLGSFRQNPNQPDQRRSIVRWQSSRGRPATRTATMA